MKNFEIEISQRGRSVTTVPMVLSDGATWLDYSEALADEIRPYAETREGARFTVWSQELGCCLLQELRFVPRKNGGFVTETKPILMEIDGDLLRMPSGVESRKLEMISAEHNNNKYYRMIDTGHGTWKAVWGRNGDHRLDGNKEYPWHMYAIKLMEKEAKGYKDVTELDRDFAKTERPREARGKLELTDAETPAIADMIVRLMNCSRQLLSESYVINAEKATPEMIEAAERKLGEMSEAGKREEFCRLYEELLAIIPRRITEVADLMPESEADFGSVMESERSLLETLKGVRSLQNARSLRNDFGLEIHEATDSQKEEVMARISPMLKGKVYKVYRVINLKTQERFDRKLAGMADKRVRMLWHGSRNENWMSILSGGLKLNPDAEKTGAMFGKGIYFAPGSMKSWGYTSAEGSRWANGSSDTAFMGLYATAYGKPYKVDRYNWRMSGIDANWMKGRGDCLHADKSRGMLRDDEIVFYDEDSTTIDYLVEFRKDGGRDR